MVSPSPSPTRVYEKRPVVDAKGVDIFGSTPLSIKKNIDCICPNCSRTLGAQKFAPHLEKCMGMGRNSTRLAASKRWVWLKWVWLSGEYHVTCVPQAQDSS